MLDKLCRDPSHLERLLQWKLLEERNLKVLGFLKLVIYYVIIQNLICLCLLKFIKFEFDS